MLRTIFFNPLNTTGADYYSENKTEDEKEQSAIDNENKS